MTFQEACAPANAGAGLILADPIAPPGEAISEAKAYLRIDGGDEDAPLARLIAVAIGHGEAFTGQTLIARAMRETLTIGGDWRRLGRAPVVSIAGVEALSPTAAPVTLGTEAFAIDIDAGGNGRVRLAEAGARRVRVTYVAGLAGGWSGLPEPIAQGVLRLAAHLFTHRDAGDEGAPPAAIAALWRPWRRMRLL